MVGIVSTCLDSRACAGALGAVRDGGYEGHFQNPFQSVCSRRCAAVPVFFFLRGTGAGMWLLFGV